MKITEAAPSKKHFLYNRSHKCRLQQTKVGHLFEKNHRVQDLRAFSLAPSPADELRKSNGCHVNPRLSQP